jgi:pentatricopeptide repeat protein
MRSEHWLREMCDAGEPFSAFCHDSVIQACAHAGQLQRAEHWLKEALKHGGNLNPNSFTSLISRCARSGELDKAEHWLAEMEKHAAAAVYQVVAACQGRAGKADRSRELPHRCP